jgi:hypothetical protein
MKRSWSVGIDRLLSHANRAAREPRVGAQPDFTLDTFFAHVLHAGHQPDFYYTKDGKPVNFVRSSYRADRYHFTATMRRGTLRQPWA